MMKKWNEHAKKGEWDEILKEADRIEKELGPDLEYPASDEEVKEAYERLMTRIKSEGLYHKLTEDENAEEDAPSKPAHEEEPKPEKPSKLHIFGKYAAMFAITLIGIFVLSMTSEANRQWVIKRVHYTFGHNTILNTQSGNIDDLESSAEDEARGIIEDELGISLPFLLYRPYLFEYSDYSIDREKGVALIHYSYKEDIATFFVSKSKNMFYNDIILDGRVEYDTEVDNQNLEIVLLKVTDQYNTTCYIAEWEESGWYYQFSGRMEIDEFKKIIEKITI